MIVHVTAADTAILRAIHSWASPQLDNIMVFITHLGNASVVISGVLLAAAALAATRHYRQALFLLIATAGTAAANIVFKQIFQRDRPELWPRLIVENGYSFPSGHAMISMAIALSAIVLCWHSRYRWLALGLSLSYVLLVSFSRLYLGVHYPSDILVGWCASAVWIALLCYCFRRILHRQNPTVTDHIEHDK